MSSNNVGIVTVCNNHNCGSFLQATALSNYISGNGMNPMILRIPRPSEHSMPAFVFAALKKKIKRAAVEYDLVKEEYLDFKKLYSQMEFYSAKDLKSHCDRIVIGSDTIWDVSRRYFRNNRQYYWGTDFPSADTVVYAASIGSTNPKDLLDIFYIDAVQSIDKISVRDRQTLKYVESIGLKTPRLVCDPTMLFDAQRWGLEYVSVDYPECILIYHFADIKNDDKDYLIRISESLNLPLISIGANRNWCEMSVPFSPTHFISLFDKAKVVFTDTFHGTVFSIIFNRQFIEDGFDKMKIRDLLGVLGIHGSDFRADPSTLKACHQIDYAKVNRAVAKLRNQSIDYLNYSLGV